MPTQQDIDFLTRRAELRAAQRLGILPQPGAISERQLAASLGMSRHMLSRVQSSALAKVARGLSERGISADLRALRSLVSSNRES